MVILICVALISGFLVVWKIRNLKSQLVEERRESVNQVLAAIGEIESLKEARHRAPAIVEIMKRYDAIGLILPLKSGGRVNFQLGSTGLRIEDK
jgi:hypothetical protein